jgi:hypothetical protein
MEDLAPVQETAKRLAAQASTATVASPVTVNQTGNALDQQTAKRVDVKDQTVCVETTATK